jgi:parallel beta-helix repeat protein
MLKPPQALAILVLLAASKTAIQAETLHVPKDYKTIQAAIEAAKPGDTILVEPGTYPERIRLKERVTLKSAGDDSPGKLGLKRAEATILDGGGAEAKEPAVVLAEAAVLDGFTVTRVGLFDQKEYDKHYATQGENLPDDRGAVGAGKNFPAVSIADVTAVVRHCIVRDNGHAGIGCTGKKNASWITKNVVYRNMGGGIGVADGARPTVEGNKCFNNLRGGIGNRNSAGLLLKNECFDNVRAGIGIREGARPIVRGNMCYKNRRAGIGCRMEGTAPLIEDNDCYENGMAGIGSRDGAKPLIRGNRCYENLLAGIGSRDGACPIIFGNKCYRNKEAGIGTQLGAKAFIAHNECYENEKAGIGQRSDAETILGGNYVHHNKKAGIGFEECKAGKSTVVHNKVIDNDLVAVGIHAGWKVRLASNELSRKDGLPPIVMVFKGSEAEFSDNVIRGSGVAGIRTEGTVRIVNNRFECPSLRKGGGPPQFAVWGLPGANIVFVENKVNGWRHALVTEKAAVIASHNEVSGYWQVGIQVSQPTAPVTAISNVFWSESGHPGINITGDQGIVEDNRIEKSRPQELKR